MSRLLNQWYRKKRHAVSGGGGIIFGTTYFGPAFFGVRFFGTRFFG